jgi:long-chain acyl-CoA synthetase
VTETFWPDLLVSRDPREVLLLSGGRAWRAGEVHAEITVLQARFADASVVAVLADNGPAWVIADLACQAAGVVHLPLPEFFSAAQLRHALEQSGADTVLSDRPERIGALDLDFGVTGRWRGLTWLRRATDAVPLPPGTAKISFTSGSTGAPKGVCLGAAGLLDTARAVCARLADLPLAAHLAALPLALLLENVAGVYAPLLRGLPVHLPPLAELGWQGMAGFDPARFDRAVRAAAAESPVSSLVLVPELLKAWTVFLARSGAAAPGSLQFVAVGGARVAPELLRSARAVGIPAYQGYGLTECGSVVALNRPGDDGDGVGRPLDHATLSLENGELQVGTRAFLGYVGSRAPAAGRFPTGDLAALDGRGHLHLAGRRNNLLITSYGRNVSPEWIEAMLLADPRILQAVVFGDGQAALGAVVVPAPGTSPEAVRAVMDRVNAALPDYARLAQHIVSEPFTVANGMATGNGRPRRRRIHEFHSAALAALSHPEVSPHVVL